MSQATDLLNSLTETQISAYSADSGEEPHIVIGSDRFITVPNSLKRIAVQFDHDVETVTFDCPRFWDNLDMSKMAVYINYILSDGYADSYPVDDVTADDDIMHFTWTISRNVTQAIGNITFLVCIKKTSGDKEVNHWNSEICRDMYVSEGLETEEQIAMENTDLITQLLLRMSSVEQINIQADEMQTLYENTQAVAATAEEVKNEALDASDYIKNSYAPAIKGKLSGTVVFADDVSPIEHNPVVKVHGKNVFNPDYIQSVHSLNALSTWGNILVNSEKTIAMLKPGTTYTTSFTAECVQEVDYTTVHFPGFGFILYNNGMEINMGRYWSNDENDWLSLGETMSVTRTFTTPENLEGWCIMAYTQRALDSDGNGVPNVLKITDLQIEEGEIATNYEACIDPSAVVVKRYGKNLLKNTLATSTSCGVTRTVNSDGSITFNGTSTEVHGIGINASIYLPDGKYILSGGLSNLYLVIWGMSVETNSWVSIAPDKGNGAEFVADSSLYTHYLAQYQGLSGVTYGCVSYPMIRAVSAADNSYEKYKEPGAYMPAADGTVSDIASLSPNMTIFTDTEGVVVECEYNRDTTKMFESYVLTDKAKNEIADIIENHVLTETEKVEIAAIVEEDMEEVLASLNNYAESVIAGGDS